MAHESDASMRTVAPILSMAPLPASSSGPTRSTTPEKPRIRPKTIGEAGRTRSYRLHSSKAIQSGTVVIRTAVSPDGTCCSAHTTPPFPPKSSSPPIIVAAFQLCLVGVGAPLRRVQRYSAEPAMRKRIPAMRNGGMVSMAMRMARYVEPHIV